MVDLQRWRRRGGAGEDDGPAGEDDTSRFAPITRDEWSDAARRTAVAEGREGSEAHPDEYADEYPDEDAPEDPAASEADAAFAPPAGGLVPTGPAGPDPTDHADDADLEDPYDDGYADDLLDDPADETAEELASDLDARPDDGHDDGHAYAYADTVVADEDEQVPAQAAAVVPAGGAGTARARGGLGDRFSLREWTPLLLLQTSHPKQAIITALTLGGVAVLTGRAPREVGVIVLTVLVGQAILGWHNDVVDRRRDRDHNVAGKPVADGRLEPGTVWYAMVAAFWVLLPLAVTTGLTAACIYMGSVAVGMLGNVLLRTGFLSFWSWAVSFAMLPAYLSYGGWGGQARGESPEVSIVVLAALLGIGVHFTRSVWGLVADHAEGWTYLPLKLGLRLGATRLLVLSSLYTAVIVVLLAVFGARDGLTR